MAGLLNTAFTEVYTHEDPNIPEPKITMRQDDPNALLECDFSGVKVLNKLIKLNIDKSPSDDRIYPTVLNKCAEELAIPLSMLFKQKCLTG